MAVRRGSPRLLTTLVDMNNTEINAVINELSEQRNMFALRSINLAIENAKLKQRIAELEPLVQEETENGSR